ncbi:MAG: arsenate reductase ArsC [Nitrosomonadales bacterium]|jgi:arsenate reductase|nr:arsenate reductase ArsC [Nitrosomonadales bacterium]
MNIAFICTHNSCRSIMAEAIAKSINSNNFNAYSAGSTPAGVINTKALETLKANNISINDLSSKSIDDLSHIRFDAVITLCGNAHKEPCPIWVGDCIKDHWGFEDPSAFTDGPEKDKAFQDLFDKLKRVISRLDELIQNNPESIATHIKHIKETLV